MHNTLSRILFACIAAPLSMLWAVVVKVRAWLFDMGVFEQKSFPLPIICVGNLSVGGTGKTPHVEYLLRLLHAEGYHVAMLSRGYGRKTKGFLLANAHTSAAELGDEPFQVSQNCPYATVAVCEKRVVGVEKIRELRPETDVIVLDDAYQHRYVKAGLNVLLTDSHRLYTHDHLLPWGRLREPASASRRAQVIVVTKCQAGERPLLQVADHQRLYYSQIVYADLEQTGENARPESGTNVVKSRKVLLIAAIANPAPLREWLLQQGASEVVLAEFRDHHDFNADDAQRIQRLWADNQCQMAVTTQKDIERLSLIKHLLPQSLQENLYVQPITVKVDAAQDNEISFNQTILQYVRTNQRNCSVD